MPERAVGGSPDAVRNWPILEQPREKLLASGPGALSDAELLAIFLNTGYRGVSAMDVARNLLKQFGSLRRLLEGSAHEVCGVPGMGRAKYALLLASQELAERVLLEELVAGDAVTSPEAARSYLKSRLRGRDREIFACMFLDNQHRLLGFEEVFQGTIDGATVHPREIVKLALRYNAAAVVLAHNHPSGIAEPSQADRRVTDRLRNALLLVDVRVLDHLIVGDGDLVSFAERGYL